MSDDNILRPSAPLFSIITVTYNAASVIARTLQSVKEQTCQLFEYIVVDGASTDDTLKLIGDASIDQLSLTSHPDEGIYHAMNEGLERARGEYIIFLNAGDTFHSADTLQIIANAAMNNDFPGIIYGQTNLVDNDGKYIGPRHLSAPSDLSVKSFKEGMVVCHQAFVALRKIARPYDCRYKLSSDYDWCIRCLQRSRRNTYIDRVLIDYLAQGATTRHHRKSLRERFCIMARHYGLFPTIGRHLSFIPRYFRRKSQGSLQ